MIDQLLNTILAAIATTIAGYLAQLLARRQREIAKSSQNQAETLAAAIKSYEANRRATSTELLLQKLPEGISPHEFLAKLEDIAARIPAERGDASPAMEPFERLINAYHEQALSQAQVQFWFSVAAATVGFVWIIYTGSTAGEADLMQLLKTLPGIAIDAVAFLYFRQAAETRDRSTQLYDRLRTDRQSTESISLVRSIADEKIRCMVQAMIALHMSGIEVPKLDADTMLGKANNTA